MIEPEMEPGPESEVAPDPGALIESMRAFGYSLPSAMADLIDNSISAEATAIDVEFAWSGSASTLTVIDDGYGMDAAGLIEAMRLGSRSPLETRSATDLGRFGLGLKSAAWSQARSLTVISKSTDGPVLAQRWDLDHVTSTGRWSLLGSTTQTGLTLIQRLEGVPSGTAVLLEQLDRLVGDEPVEDEPARERFLAAVRATEAHLAMVFHRFLTGRKAITLRVNTRRVEPWDPFLETHDATQRLPTEDLPLEGRKVHVAPHVLPHVSKLDSRTHSDAAGPRGWNAHQGFYVYRARRLLVAGDWLGLSRMQQEEHYKLARIRIDLDNSMDHAWQIDVRKATARIPGPLQPELRRIAQTTRQRAAEAYRFRGKNVARRDGTEAMSFVWERVAHRDGVHTFRVNRHHPVLKALGADSDQAQQAVERALRLAEENLPVEAIVLDARENPEDRARLPFAGRDSEVDEMLRNAHAAMVGTGTDPRAALRSLAAIEPFEAYPEIVQILAEEISR
jgi:Histidine kinase-, DNA gyrase B-, and HSP90-like ATPase